MRLLKSAMILFIALLVLAILLVGYFFATANVSIAAFKATGITADTNAALFADLKSQIEQNALIGTQYKAETLGDASQYAFITYTLRLNNQCLIPIDMIEVQVVPKANDILQIGDLKVHSLDAKSQGDITATILTTKDSNSIRELIVTYYVWGVSYSIRETYGA